MFIIRKASDVFLEIAEFPQTIDENAKLALEALRRTLSHVLLAGEPYPFTYHKRAGGIERYFIAGCTSRVSLEKIVSELNRLKFTVFLIADLLIIENSGFPNSIKVLEFMERNYRTKRCFSGDFPQVVLARKK